jgi:hexosaminidase
MKKIAIALCCYLLGLHAIGQNESTSIAIIPEPVQLVKNAGSFILPNTISIEAPDLTALKATSNFLQQRLSLAAGYNVTISNNSPTPTIKLVLNKTPNQIIGNEGTG